MGEMAAVKDLKVGSEIAGWTRAMTEERIQWYGDGLESAIAGKFTRVGVNIHTDEEFAKSQGLTAVIADGMISTNYLSSMMVRQFGTDYLERGELRTKFIKPVYKDVVVSTKGRVRSIERLENGDARYVVEVWCEDQDGTRLTDGDAVVTVKAGR